ncbi:hypothetical protein V8C86DRAFT_2442037 [Haematococcus lacustris]
MTDPTEEKTIEELVPVDWQATVLGALAYSRSGSGLDVTHYHDSCMLVNDLIAGNVAASLVSGLCKSVQGVHLNNINLKNLRDRCLDILDVFLQVGGIGAFISTFRSSSELPKLSKKFIDIMNRFVACIKKVIAHCKNYTREGIIGKSSRFFLHLWHKEEFEALTTELNGLTAFASLALGVINKISLEKVEDKLIADMPPVGAASSVMVQARLKEDMPFVVLAVEVMVVPWGVWWTVFPGELALDKTLDEAAREKLVGSLTDKDSKDAFRRAVELEDTIFISIDELCLSFPDDSPLLPTVEALLCKGRQLVRDDAVKAQNQEKMAMAEAGRGQKLVRWGVWWAVFPGKLALDDTLDEAAREKLVGLLTDKDSKDLFRRAVELEDTIFISIDELCLSFPDDSPLLPTVEALLCKGRQLVREDKDRTELAKAQEKMAMAEAGRGQKLVSKGWGQPD